MLAFCQVNVLNEYDDDDDDDKLEKYNTFLFIENVVANKILTNLG